MPLSSRLAVTAKPGRGIREVLEYAGAPALYKDGRLFAVRYGWRSRTPTKAVQQHRTPGRFATPHARRDLREVLD